MNLYNRLLISICIASALSSKAQNAVFVSEGKIEYEKKLNLYEQMKEWDEGDWTDVMKKAVPKFKTNYYDLSFSGNKTFYRPGKDNPENDKIPGWMSEQPGESNIIFTNLDSSKSISQKKVYDMSFLLADSTRIIKWKITDETRTIAGFNCRRANAMIMDSVYVVAFYTDEIITRGGPESFTGLPGMILGLALPHQHVTWFATHVELAEINPNLLVPPNKGKKVTNASLKETLNDRMKEWGKQGRRIILYAML